MRTIILTVFLFLIVGVQSLFACESCAITHIGRRDKVDENIKHKVTAKVLYEHQDWKDAVASQLHTLHHQGHHVHDKQDEEIIHTMLNVQATNLLSLNVDIPYVTKHYIEVDSHPHMGENQTSKGLGDITMTGDYRLIQDQRKSFGVIAGVKAPTGKTSMRNSFGGLMEPELQPGSGSLDYIGGLSGAVHPNNLDFVATAIYIYRTEGKQNFKNGDLLSITLYGGRSFHLNDQMILKTGIMFNNQLEKKQKDEDGFIKDSGGFMMLAGPQFSLEYDQLMVEFSYLAPAIQNLGGIHQELDKGIWTAAIGCKF